MAKQKPQTPADRLRFLYITALISIAVIAGISQYIVWLHLARQKNDSKIINLSGRQRMLSQRITKELLLYQLQGETQGRDISRKIAIPFQELTKTHQILSQSDSRYFGNQANSDRIKALYTLLQPSYDSLFAACTTILQRGPNIPDAILAKSLQTLLPAEPRFLALMDQITFQYEVEFAAKVIKLQHIEWTLFFITLVILLLEGLFILTPAVKKLAAYYAQLDSLNLRLSQKADALRHSRRLLLSSTLEAQEKERKAIAMDLHDGLGPLILLAQMNLQRIEQPLDPHTTQCLEKAQQYLAEIGTSTKFLSRTLHPPDLETLGLIPALEQLIAENRSICPATIRFYHALPQPPADRSFNLHVYRIVQELLTNAIRHADPGEIALQVFMEEDRLVIMAEDDGKGIEHPNPLTSEGFGLKNITSRVNSLQGKLIIDSQPSEGTTITIYLPFLPDTSYETDPNHPRG